MFYFIFMKFYFIYFILPYDDLNLIFEIVYYLMELLLFVVMKFWLAFAIICHRLVVWIGRTNWAARQ